MMGVSCPSIRTGVRAVAGRLRARSVVALAQGRACEGIYVAASEVTIGVELGSVVATWGSAVTALGRELDLLVWSWCGRPLPSCRLIGRVRDDRL
jgi:hypothetical protein